MPPPRTAVECLTITLPEQNHQPVRYQAHHANQRRESWDGPPAPSLTTATTATSIWREIRANWHDRRDILTRHGAVLGRWLLDDRAIAFLRGWVASWKGGEAPGRVGIVVPTDANDFLWEAAAVEGIHFLATHPALTVVRLQPSSSAPPPLENSPISLHVVAVDHAEDQTWGRLDTSQEARRIHNEITEAVWGIRFHVTLDVLGDWDRIASLYDQERVNTPAILHFAGHGGGDGKNLVFRGPHGMPRVIEAGRIARVWSTPDRRGHRTRFVFLNACSTSKEGSPVDQPFGGITRQLIAHGIDMVAGLLAPVQDQEAQEISRTFYQQVGRGAVLDLAIQEARRAAFEHDDLGVAWAFLVFTSAGHPSPLRLAEQRHGTNPAYANFLRFAFEKQWMRLQHFLDNRLPMVVVVPGEEHTGHRHLLRRFQFELENKPGETRYVTVMTMNLSRVKDPRVARNQLLGALAVTFGVSQTGPESEIIQRVGKAVAFSCENNTILVVDLEEVLLLSNTAWSEALLHLIHVLWVEVMNAAAIYQSERAVYLLVSVAWPSPKAPDHPQSAAINHSLDVSLQTINKLKEKRRPARDIQVVTLPELEPITEDYVADYLETVMRKEPEEALSMAQTMVDLNNNETILRKMEDWMASEEGAP